jgi:large subunit ribosomal protein L3
VGHARKAGLEAAPTVLRDFRLGDSEQYEVGQKLTVEQFEKGDRVKVTGTSKGKGFQGVVKRHGFTGRPSSHGHPLSRNPGSIGPGTNPSRTIKGKKLPGRMGGERTTVRNLQIVRVDLPRNLLFVKGAIPGARDGYVLISK